MISPASEARAQLRLRLALGAALVMLLGAPPAVDAQGLVKGVQQGAKEGNKAAGPVGGVLGGAIGGVVGVFTGVLGVGKSGPAPSASGEPSIWYAEVAQPQRNPSGKVYDSVIGA